MESHHVTNLTVVFLDEYSLHEQWKTMTATQPIRFVPQMASAQPAIKTLRGFYDPITATLYCAKWDYETCGHELHHAVLGAFHPPD